MSRKNRLSVSGFLLILAGVCFLSSYACAGQARQKLRLAYHPNWGPMSVPAADMKGGFFAEEGFDVEWIKFTSGAPEIAAIVSGDIDFGYIGHGALALCADGRASVISFSHFTNSEAVLVRKASGITSMQGLKDKVVGTELGTSAEVVLNIALETAGMTRDDIRLINMPITSAISAFIGGSIDGVVAWGSDITNIVNNVDEELVSVAQTADFREVTPFLSTWVADNDYVKKNEDTTIRFLRALNKCYAYRFDDLDRNIVDCAEFAKKVDIGVTYKDLLPERDQLVFFSNDDARDWIKSGKMADYFKKHLDYMKKTGRITSDSVKVEDYVQFDLMGKGLGM